MHLAVRALSPKGQVSIALSAAASAIEDCVGFSLKTWPEVPV